MFIGSMILSSILLGVLKFVFPSDYPAYVVVIPIMSVGAFYGMLKVLEVGVEMAKKMESQGHQPISPKPYISRFEKLERSEDGKVIDINPLLKKRNRPNLRLVESKPQGDDIA